MAPSRAFFSFLFFFLVFRVCLRSYTVLGNDEASHSPLHRGSAFKGSQYEVDVYPRIHNEGCHSYAHVLSQIGFLEGLTANDMVEMRWWGKRLVEPNRVMYHPRGAGCFVVLITVGPMIVKRAKMNPLVLSLFALLTFSTRPTFAANSTLHDKLSPMSYPSGPAYDSVCLQQAAELGEPDPEAWIWSSQEGLCVHAGARNTWSAQHVCAPFLNEFDEWLKSQPVDAEIIQMNALNSSDPEIHSRCSSFIQQRLDARSNLTSASTSALDRRQDDRFCPDGLGPCVVDCERQFHGKGQQLGLFVCRAKCAIACGTDRGGCYKGWCWAGCSSGVPGFEGKEWCYTTKSYSQSFEYVRCNEDNLMVKSVQPDRIRWLSRIGILDGKASLSGGFWYWCLRVSA
ncbi:hypothetical protein BDZ91DRAFT_786602 [Kalaharituber pfeilii]|nr:hypothetical protein BDZ91DRAFT_786602 [Kalaharituber pfeilii]